MQFIKKLNGVQFTFKKKWRSSVSRSKIQQLAAVHDPLLNLRMAVHHLLPLSQSWLTKSTKETHFFQNAINMRDEGWKQLNYRWIIFFIFVAILNEIVWRTQTEVFWVNFKVWGLLPISFLFAASQISLINKYKLK